MPETATTSGPGAGDLHSGERTAAGAGGAEKNVGAYRTDGGRHDGAAAVRGAQAEAPTSRPGGRRREDRIIAASPLMQRALDRALAIARTDQVVLVRGPAGSGKSMLARAIHGWSAVAGGPLETLFYAGVPEPLQSRELFGCRAGTYPAIPDAFEGALGRAAGGTLLVEGLDMLVPAVRSALARALEVGRYRPEGDVEERPVRARIIATAERWSDPSFSVPVHEIALAPLSERPEDVLPLAVHFLGLSAAEIGLNPVGFAPDARSALLEEAWPGNVTELRERIRQAVRLAGKGAVGSEALLLAARGDRVPSFREAKRAFEARYVEGLLRLCDGNISQAARLAKKDRKDFYDVIRRTGVDPSVFRR
jgi:two-component system response regulator GlrR